MVEAMTIRISNLSKSYGEIRVLDDITFTVADGECFCLLGRNGAGKTTLINIMCDMIPADSGTVMYDKLTFETDESVIKQKLGVLPENDPTIAELTGHQYLEFIARLHKISHSEFKNRKSHLLDLLFDDTNAFDRRIATYSRGMRQKLALAAALIHNPAYLLLDEPFANLDPVVAARLVSLIRDLRAQGTALLVSSHSLNYVEQIADRLGVLEKTKLCFMGTVAELTGGGTRKIESSLLKILTTGEPLDAERMTR